LRLLTAPYNVGFRTARNGDGTRPQVFIRIVIVFSRLPRGARNWSSCPECSAAQWTPTHFVMLVYTVLYGCVP
jgi:hypothetical protein